MVEGYSREDGRKVGRLFYCCPANRRSLNHYKVHGTPTNSQKPQSSLKE